MGNPVVHFEIMGKAMDQLHGFYSELFDWKIQMAPEMNYGLVDTGGGGINGGIGQTEEGSSMTTFYVEVDDPQAYLDRAAKLGAKTIVPVTEVPNVVTFALFEDPQGNRVGLVKGT